MSGFEIFGTVFGLISIWLTVRASVWCWPTGIVNIALYLVTYTEARLYSDVVNYLVMLALSIWGWIEWARGPRRPARPIATASPRARGAALAAAALGSLLMGWLFATFTDASMPYWDSLVAAPSLVAQVLLALKLVENWYFWIFADVVAIGVYLVKGLWLVAALYAVYLGFCLVGVRKWRRQV
jgi:nicotinamide mononucleotide transporter